MLKQKYFLADIFILSAEKQPIKLSWRKIEWLLILPSCRLIGRGAVISSGSVVVKDIEPMSIVGGNPAQEFKKRKCVHSALVVESLLGGDYKIYKQTRKNK